METVISSALPGPTPMSTMLSGQFERVEAVMALLEQFDSVSAEFSRLVAATPLDALEDPTPCTEWTVRLLLNHVVTGTQRYVCVIEGRPTPDRSIDQVGDDPVGAFARRLEQFRAAIGRPGALDGTYHHASGDMSGSTYLKMRANEFLVHGWDLARATGQVPDFSDELCDPCIEMYREILAVRVREPGRGFGVEFPVDEGAPALDRLVAFFGRTP